MIAPVWIIIGIASAIVMMAASRIAVDHAIKLAEMLRLPPFIIGVVLVAVGTDMPEMVNSIVSSYLGHGDINVGDSTGSVFTQATLVLGLFPFVAGAFPTTVQRQAPIVLGLTILALLLGAWLLSDGMLSHVDAGMLILAWVSATAVVGWRSGDARASTPRSTGSATGALRHSLIALLALAAVGGAAGALVYAIAAVSARLGIPEYLLSFFGASVGTSLPELAVEFTALRRGQRGLALGDVLGSCLVDASLSVAIGPLLFPTTVTAVLAIKGAVIAIAAVAFAMILLRLRRNHDYLSGAILVVAYLAGYVLLL